MSRDDNGATQTWKTDGTVAGTRPLVDAAPAAAPFAGTPFDVVKGRLVLLNLVTAPDPNAPGTYRCIDDAIYRPLRSGLLFHCGRSGDRT